MIHRLKDLIGPASEVSACGRVPPDPVPAGVFGRLRDAWAVVCGRAFAVAWPKPGELEEALGSSGRPNRAADRWVRRLKLEVLRDLIRRRP